MLDTSAYALSLLRRGDMLLYRGVREGTAPMLLAVPTGEPPLRMLQRIEREFALRQELNPSWAALPIALTRFRGEPALAMQDPGGVPLDRAPGQRLDLAAFLPISIAITQACGRMHDRGLIHKDIRPSNILADLSSGSAWLTGFGLASRLARERHEPLPPEGIAGTLAYMAPEQTGRMNRSIDSRSDLYALGVTFYELLTGRLPFDSSDPMELVHCHIARQPVPPHERVPSIPKPLSAIVMKLLAKTMEERYQTAAGLERDLRHCLERWSETGQIEPFVLAERDTSDRLLIPEKLYGREREIEALLHAFGDVVHDGRQQLVMVSGYSGIGKSSVVNELHKALVPSHGLFAAGKFDQHKRDIPYATLAQAFHRLVQTILGRPEEELAGWRGALAEALGLNGRLMVDLIPQIELIVGPQPVPAELPPLDARNRFQMVFRRFIGAFARAEHPLALFLDDLQWLDSATLDLLQHLATHEDMQHLLLIGAYRSNEVSADHPLIRALDDIRKAGTPVREIVLKPLAPQHVVELVTDSFHAAPGNARPLAELVHEKTDGNPFFAIQFILELVEEKLIVFDLEGNCWAWDLPRIRNKGYTENVVDLMLRKLSRLPKATQDVLKQLACLGNAADIRTLALVQQKTIEEVAEAFAEPIQPGFVIRREMGFAFLHDRMQEACYAMVPEGERATTHLRIGRLLAGRLDTEAGEEAVFDVVDQLNRGGALIGGVEERERTAAFNLRAGRRARSSTAYRSALAYFIAGLTLLPADRWLRCYRLAFDLELHRAECELLTGEIAGAEQRLLALEDRAASLDDKAAVARLRIALQTILGRFDMAIEIGLGFLSNIGISWTRSPSEKEVRREYALFKRRLGARPVEGLAALPPMRSSRWRTTMEVCTDLIPPAIFVDPALLELLTLRMANISLKHGNCDASCYAYALLNVALGFRFGDYETGFRFGQLGCDLIERPGLDRFKTRVLDAFGCMTNHWMRPVSSSRALHRRGIDAANATGDITFAAFNTTDYISACFSSGDPLEEVEKEAERGLAFARRTQFEGVAACILRELRIIASLRGTAPDFGTVDAEAEFKRLFSWTAEEKPGLVIVVCYFWVRRLQACVLAGAHIDALAAAERVEATLWAASTQFCLVDYHFYAGLARIGAVEMAPVATRAALLRRVVDHREKLSLWASICPDNYACRSALLEAEAARRIGDELAAERLYEEAIRLARRYGFIQIEALANELAARFHAGRGFETIAHAYIRNARNCYLRWGAAGAARRIEVANPHLLGGASAASADAAIGTRVEQLDLGTAIKVSQAVSGEIDLDRLIETLMTVALEHAGADRGLLLLSVGDASRVEAEARISGDRVEVTRRPYSVASGDVPDAILHYVARSREPLLLDDVTAATPFLDAQPTRHGRRGSLLCLPLVRQTQLLGLLYLENNQATHAFPPARVALLNLLASQAAISLENAKLYEDLLVENRERRRAEEALRRSEVSLAEGQRISHCGSWRWDVKTGAIECSTECLRIFQLDPAVDSPTITLFFQMVHPEDRDRAERLLASAIRDHAVYAYEYRIVVADGSTKILQTTGVPALTEAGELEFFGTAIDLTELRQTEAALSQAQAELARVTRLTTMGELAGSIIHEINQPLAAVVTNAEASMRWLDRQVPDLSEVRTGLSNVLRDGMRAAKVIAGLRSLVRRSELHLSEVDLNEAIREVLTLCRGDLERGGVTLDLNLSEARPVARGDRVQLQQVLLNLIRNGIEAMDLIRNRTRMLRISTGLAEDNRALVTVEDSGPGMDVATIERIFDPLFTTKQDGMGMGLSICQTIVEAHKGRVWAAASDLPGAALCFTVPLALTISIAPPAERPPATATATGA